MRIFLALAAVTFLVMADEPPKGVPARPAASDYAAQAQWQNATFAASLVPPKQVEHLFAFDISKAYIVFEVACYADSAADLKVSREGFVVKVNASGDAIHNAEPDIVASAIQRQNEPPMPSSHSTNVETRTTVGYEHGTDPYTGRPVSGVYTGEEVGIGRGGQDGGQSQPQYPKPGGTSEDRRMLEAQLRARSLPEGPVNHPVAGYIFFRKSDLKTQPDGTYALQYLAEEDGSGATHAVALAVPKKAR
jgi:hypothetical protein